MDSMDGQLETKLDWSTHSLESSDDITRNVKLLINIIQFGLLIV